MKKFFSVALVLVACFILTGCFWGKTVTCSSEIKQKNYTISTDYKISSIKDIVTKVTIKTVIESKEEKVLKDFKSQLEEQYKSNSKSYGGYDYKVTIKGQKLTADVTIDYKKFNLEKFVKANGAMKEYVNKKNELTLDGAKKMYKSTGAKCK